MIQTLMPYLLFDGDCRQAMTFYQRVFDAEVVDLLLFGDSGFPLSEVNPEWVMNATIKIGGQAVGVADKTSTQEVTKASDSPYSIFLEIENESQLKTIYQQLVEGGEIITALERSFWESNYGKVQDAFGITWELNQQLVVS